MTLQLDASTPARVQKTATGNTATTASFTAPANALLLAFWGQDSTGETHAVVTDSGGLTWTQIVRLSSNSVNEPNTPTPSGTTQPALQVIYYAKTTSSAARTVTVTESGAGGTGHPGQLYVAVITDSNGGTPDIGNVVAGGGAGTAPSKLLVTTFDNSWVWAGSSDYSSAGTGTVGSNQTMRATHDDDNVSAHVWSQTNPTPSAITSVTMNLATPSSQEWNVGVVEVLAGTGGGGGNTEQRTTSTLWGSGTPVTGQSNGSWSNPTNATGPNDAARAQWTSTGSGATGWIRVEGHDAQGAIGAEPLSIDSVSVTVYAYDTNNTRMASIAVQLADGGTLIGTAQSMTKSTSTTNFQTFTFTGVTWAQLANLGVRVLFTRGSVTTAANGLVDAISMQVTYTVELPAEADMICGIPI